MSISTFRGVAAFALAVLLVGSRALGAPDNDSYMRIGDDEQKQTVSLEVALRKFTPPNGEGPTVTLVGVAHIGDQAYYDALQSMLDAHDLVLYEGVKPAAVEEPGADADDASRSKLTKQRVRMLGIEVERFRRENKRLPRDFDEAIGSDNGPGGRLMRTALIDGWGHAITLMPIVGGAKGSTFDVISLGGDGKDGGEGSAADIKLSGLKAITDDEVGAGEGIQVKLARALKLEFQLAALDYTKANWRNSDMTIEELMRRLGGGEGEGKPNALLGMLSGQGFMSKMVGFLLGFIEASPSLSAQTKLMVVEMLGHADELLESQGSAMLGVGGAELMKVLIEDRNEVVLQDLARVAAETPAKKSVAIFYGAGHLKKMQTSLIQKGYTPGEFEWHRAITVDLKDFPGGAESARATRAMVKKMIEMQVKKK